MHRRNERSLPTFSANGVGYRGLMFYISFCCAPVHYKGQLKKVVRESHQNCFHFFKKKKERMRSTLFRRTITVASSTAVGSTASWRRGTSCGASAVPAFDTPLRRCCSASLPLAVGAEAPFGVSIASLSTATWQDKDDAALMSQLVRIRGRAETIRVKGSKLGFMQLRQPFNESIQVVLTPTSQGDKKADAPSSSSSPLDIGRSITPESVVDVWGILRRVPKPVSSVSCANIELHATKVVIVSLAETPLPFPLRDPNTKLDTRLDHRVMDLRTTATGAIARLVSIAGNAFRDHLLSRDFVEIHTPKMIGTPSEGGSSVFKLDYFGKPAFLAQSPQLYKQMVLMGDVPRVFEVGPVFRAENSLTHRHLTEFVGLDAELVIHSNYTEVLDVLEGTLVTVLQTLDRDGVALRQLAMGGGLPVDAARPEPVQATVSADIVRSLGIGAHDTPQQPSTDTYGAYVSSHTSPFPVLRFSFDAAVQMLTDHGVLNGPVDDFTTAQEKQLGTLVKRRYGVDVYVVDKFPASARPFYTMPLAGNPQRTCSYDAYLRGEEICSGAQRIHDPALLLERMRACGINVSLIQDYVDAFRYGAWPHGGFGLGLERIVLFYLGISDVRMVSLFPRDPKRIAP